MEFDPSFQGQLQHPFLSTHFPTNPNMMPQIQTMFPSQSPILIPSSPPPPIMFHPNNTFHHIQDHTFGIPTQNPNFLFEGPLKPTTTPFCGMLTPSLGSSLGGFANVSHHHPMMLPPPNNNNALHGQHEGKVIWDFSQKTMIHPSYASSSSNSPSPLSFPNITQYKWKSNQKIKMKKDTNDLIIKGWWTPEEDSSLVELVNEFGLKKWTQIAKFLPGRIGKQCRERWYNHLQPNIKKESWNLEEDMILMKVHQEIGNKWSEIAKRLPGRTENNIKNHWNGIKRRQDYKRNNNKNNDNPNHDESMLHAYIKRVTVTEEAARVQKKSVSKNNKKDQCSYNMLDGNSNLARNVGI
ncbi:hypothetical protein LR48_Vigan10g280400 [Vigna angularis]|uniref:Uncharacterized protein n=1 Tax=Phaseolus angularis TaxID=3914 RepID=A0A0L9VPT3_PHAAN|nr:transcription factor MYB118 [Vigna angularis]KOM56912.1 hypothetical protein LR48_Vigan10g280400 [Vigna angularis]